MSSKGAFQIVIPRRAPTCSRAFEPFTPGMEFHSVLKEGDDGEYVRLDYCLKCWEKHREESAQEQIASSWESTVPLKKEASDLPKQRDARALYLLKETLNHSDSDSIAEAFVLSLYLARRRRLLSRQEMKLADGRPAMVYEVAETEEMLCVPKLPLSELQVEKVQQALAKKFS